jgi:hypothetical protein
MHSRRRKFSPGELHHTIRALCGVTTNASEQPFSSGIATMQVSSSGADLSEREIAQMIERAKLARVQFLFGSSGLGMKAIGVTTLACVLAFLVATGARSPSQQALENTVAIERMAMRLAHAEKISAETAGEVSKLLRQPDHDCRRIACDARLEKRNLAARSRLQTILAGSTLQADAADR